MAIPYHGMATLHLASTRGDWDMPTLIANDITIGHEERGQSDGLLLIMGLGLIVCSGRRITPLAGSSTITAS